MINGRKMQVHDLKNEDEIIFGPQVRAIYYLLQHDTTPPGQTDASEYDITLINPGMELSRLSQTQSKAIARLNVKQI